MTRHVILGTACVAVLAGCVDAPALVVGTSATPRANPAAQTPCFPSEPDGAVTYSRISPAAYVGFQRYAFYTDATFCRYTVGVVRPFEFAGRYSRNDSLIVLDFDAWNTAGRWDAEATLRGDSLIVRYNSTMDLAGFESAIYLRDAGEAP